MQHELPISSSENTFFSCPRHQHSSSLPTNSSLNWSALLLWAFLMQVHPNQVLASDLLFLLFTSLRTSLSLLLMPSSSIFVLWQMQSFCPEQSLFLYICSTYICTYSTLLFSEWSLPVSNRFSSFTHTPSYKLSSSSMLGLLLLLSLTIARHTTTLPLPQHFCIQQGMYQVLSKSPLIWMRVSYMLGTQKQLSSVVFPSLLIACK